MTFLLQSNVGPVLDDDVMLLLLQSEGYIKRHGVVLSSHIYIPHHHLH